jgi:hypothetical protein
MGRPQAFVDASQITGNRHAESRFPAFYDIRFTRRVPGFSTHYEFFRGD